MFNLPLSHPHLMIATGLAVALLTISGAAFAGIAIDGQPPGLDSSQVLQIDLVKPAAPSLPH